MKFGGSSVRDAAHIKKAVSIFTAEAEKAPDNVRAVICSAMKGVTDTLIAAGQKAAAGDGTYSSLIKELRDRHDAAVQELFTEHKSKSKSKKPAIAHTLAKDFSELVEVCHGVFLLKECSRKSLDFIMSLGERVNNQLISAYAASIGQEVFYVDARALVISENGIVDFAESFSRIQKYFQPRQGIGIVTGFIASDRSGITTTLGRNGSDYSASIFAAALGAESIEIWTDVNGVLEADPAVVREAAVIDELSVDEALELSYFGAEVLHPSTMIPAIKSNIPIWIKNTMNPAARGTRIAADARTNPNIITGIASISGVSLINIIGNVMIGTSGTAMKIFSAFSKGGVNIIMISQASSEHSICVIIRSEEIPAAIRGLREELKDELGAGTIQDISVQDELEIVAVIGANMRGRPGVSGRLFKTLGDEGINILAIAQGSSEMNISFVISRADHAKSLQSIHHAFFVDKAQP